MAHFPDSKKIGQILDYCYDKALNGLPGAPSAEDLAKEYLAGTGTLDQKIDSLINWQTTKCGVSGFVTGLGGLITLPVFLPADLSATYYVQLRMIAAIAYMKGYPIRSDRVRTLAYVSLCGCGAVDLLKEVSMGALLLRMKGVVNVGRGVPLVGGLVGAGANVVACRQIGRMAKRVFSSGS